MNEQGLTATLQQLFLFASARNLHLNRKFSLIANATFSELDQKAQSNKQNVYCYCPVVRNAIVVTVFFSVLSLKTPKRDENLLLFRSFLFLLCSCRGKNRE